MAQNASVNVGRSVQDDESVRRVDVSPTYPAQRPMGGGGVTLTIIFFALVLIGLIWMMIGMGYNTYSN